jgi:hypothetical protein
LPVLRSADAGQAGYSSQAADSYYHQSILQKSGIDFKLILESMSDLVAYSSSKKDSKALLETLRESELKSALENKDFAEKFERFKCYAARKEQQSTVRSTFVPSYL